MLFELAFESGAVCLGGTAPKVLYVVSGHNPMVTQTVLRHGMTKPKAMAESPCVYAEAAVLRDMKHSRQNTGRPCVGRKGTVVCFPHPEQVAWVSTFV